MNAKLAGLLLLNGVQASIYDAIWPRAATVAPNCTLYTVQDGDTCFSVGAKQNVTFSQLLSWNSDINTICSNLGNLTGASICISNPQGSFAIPTNSQGAPTATTPAPVPAHTPDGTNSYCGEYYYVASGDDCGKITEKFGITLSDFRFLNPEVWQNCTNLLAEEYYCVEPVGDIKTYPGYGGSPTTTAPFDQTSTTPKPNIGDPWANYTSSSPVIPIANGTRVDCFSYIVLDNLTENSAADCWSLANVYGTTPEDFILWNPSLGNGESSSSVNISPATTTAASLAATNNPYAYPCTLSANTSYCVELMSPTRGAPAKATAAPPSPRAAGETANCTEWYRIEAYDTCDALLVTFYLDIADFFAMNPAVKSDCTGMNLGTYYCISTNPGGVDPVTTLPDDFTITASPTTTSSRPPPSGTGVTTPSPTQSGMVGNCNAFYDVQSGDGCWAIANEYGIALDDFYTWNPAVGTDCHDLEPDVYVCVGVSTATATPTTTVPPTTSTTTTAAGGVATPTPTQSGMVSGCNKFYEVQSGDGCWTISNEYNISLDDFYKWNPGVDQCNALWPTYYVCVGVSS